MAELYDRKLVELRKLERLSGAGKISAAPAPVLRELPDRLSLEQLIFVTPSCAANEPKRRAIEATWGETLRRRGVRQFFIVGCPELDRASSLGQVIYVPCRDDYESLLLKLALAYEYLLANEKNFTHIFKIDDDCYLNLTRFEQNLLCMEVQAIMSLGPFSQATSGSTAVGTLVNVVMQDSTRNIRMIFLRLRMQKVDMDTCFQCIR